MVTPEMRHLELRFVVEQNDLGRKVLEANDFQQRKGSICFSRAKVLNFVCSDR